MSTLKIIGAILFVLTSGAVFAGNFKKNRYLAIAAGLVALIASIFLIGDVKTSLAPKGNTKKNLAEGPEGPKSDNNTLLETVANESEWKALRKRLQKVCEIIQKHKNPESGYTDWVECFDYAYLSNPKAKNKTASFKVRYKEALEDMRIDMEITVKEFRDLDSKWGFSLKEGY